MTLSCISFSIWYKSAAPVGVNFSQILRIPPDKTDALDRLANTYAADNVSNSIRYAVSCISKALLVCSAGKPAAHCSLPLTLP